MLTPSEQRDVQQALAVAEELNSAALSMQYKPSARIQFIAHIIAALGLAQANKIDYRTVMSTVHKMHKEMNRTANSFRKPKLTLIAKGIQEETKK